MEKRLILAIVLSFLVLFLYQLIFIKPCQPWRSFSQPEGPESLQNSGKENRPGKRSPALPGSDLGGL